MLLDRDTITRIEASKAEARKPLSEKYPNVIFGFVIVACVFAAVGVVLLSLAAL